MSDLEGLTWAGIGVASFAVHAVDVSGLLTVPARVGENIPVYGAHGARRVPRKKFGPRRFVLEFLVRGVDQLGRVPPSGMNSQFYTNLDVLMSLVGLDEAVLAHTLPDGTTRQLGVEVVAEVDPRRYLAGSLGRVPVAFEAAHPFWADTAVTTVGPLTLANNATRELTELAGCSAPMDDGLVTLGPGPNPRLVVEGSGYHLAYRKVIPAGQGIRFDGATYSYEGVGGLVPDWTAIENGPDAAWLSLECGPGGAAPVIRMHTSGGSAQVTLAYRRKWLIG